MKTIKPIALAVLLTSCGAAPLSQAHEYPAIAEHPKTAEHPTGGNDLVVVLADAGEFKTLVTAIQAAGLEKKLEGKGPFTIFAPTDAAFAKLPDGQMEDLLDPANKAMLAGLLACHVVPGTIMVENMKTMKAANINGQDLNIQVSDDAVTCNNARVVQADLVATNGVIHAIDTVIVMTSTGEKAASEKPKDHPAH